MAKKTPTHFEPPIVTRPYGHSQDWNSVTQLVDHAIGTADTATGYCYSRQGDEWAGENSFNGAVQIARKGWPEATEEVVKYSNMIWSKVGRHVFRPAVKHNDEGFEWDMDRVLQGEMESALDFHNPPSKRLRRGSSRSTVRIFVTVDAYAKVGSATMKQRGAAIAALVFGLEQSGRRAEVIATCASPSMNWGESSILSHEIMVKHANAKLNLPALMYAIAHPSVLRRMLFAVWEGYRGNQKAINEKYFGGSYGIPAEHPTPERADIFIGIAHYNSPSWKSAANIEKWVLDTLEKQGVIITGKM